MPSGLKIQPDHGCSQKEKCSGVSHKGCECCRRIRRCLSSTPIGVNLPNANWIRADHGSKSVSLGNIETWQQCRVPVAGRICLYQRRGTGTGKELRTAGWQTAHTAMHEVIGQHASGKINDGVGTPKETLSIMQHTLKKDADLSTLLYL